MKKESTKSKFEIPDFLELNYLTYTKEGQILSQSGLDKWFEGSSPKFHFKPEIGSKLVPLISLFPKEKIALKIVIEGKDYLIQVNKISSEIFILIATELPDNSAALKQGKEFDIESLTGIRNIYIVRLNPQGLYTYANKAFCEKFGYTLESIKGVNFRATVHPDDHNKCSETVKELLKNPNLIVSNTIRKPDKSGNYLETEWEYQARVDKQGNLEEIQAIGKDLSELNQLISDLRKTNEQINLAIEGGDLVIWDWLLEIGKIRLNKRWWDILQASEAEESISMSAWEKWIYSEDLNRVKIGLFELTQQESQKIDMDFRVRTNYGNLKHLHITGRVMEYTENGKVRRISGIIRDVSEKKERENQNRIIEERNHAIISNFSDGVVIQDMNGAIISCNKSAEDILGLSFEQMLGRKSIDERWKSIHEDGRLFPGTEHPAMVTLQTGKPQKDIVMGIHKPDGKLTWININTQLLFKGSDREPYAVFAIFHDFTEKKLIQDELQKNRAILDETSRMAHVGGWEYYLESNSFVWTDEVYRIHGLNPGTKITPEESSSFYHPESRPIVHQLFQILIETGKPFDSNLTLKLRDGRLVDVHVIGKPWYEGGKLKKIFGSMQDISLQKQQESELMYERNRLQNILEATEAGTYEWNPITNEVWVNNRWTEMLGYSRGEIQIKKLEDIEPFFHQEDYPIVMEKALAHLEGKSESYSVEVRMQTKQGKSIWVYDRGKIIKRNSKGEPLLVAGTHIEITRNKEMEQELTMLSLVAENLSNLVILTELNGSITWVNPAFTELSGIPLTSLKGRHLREFFPENLEPLTKEEIWGQLNQSKGYRTVWKLKDKVNHLVEVRFEVGLMRNKEGQPIAILANGFFD